MTVVERIEVLTVDLPFRFSFGHALAARRTSTNVLVRLQLDDGSVGYGEGVPREYVTGETVGSAVAVLADALAPALLGTEVDDADDVPAAFEDALRAAAPADGPPPQAARCALELAFLDACGHRFGRSIRGWLGLDGHARELRYDAVIPFARPERVAAIALAARLAGMRRAKIKVGDDLETDLRALAALRRVLGPRADLRVDANAAWDPDEAIAAAARMRRHGISGIEQPVAPEDPEAMRTVTAAVPEAVIADESLRTVEEATELAETRGCDAFNIRVSKCGGLLESARIARIGAQHGLALIVGAQVGESGVLSAAGRHLAAGLGTPRGLEGSAGRLLLKHDLTCEDVMPGRGGRARAFEGPGLGVRVDEARLGRLGRVVRTLTAGAAGVRP